MATSKGDHKPTKESPRSEKKGKNENAKEQPFQSRGKKGPKEVDGKKDGKSLEATKKSPRKNGKDEELESIKKDAPLEPPNVELQEVEKLASFHQLCASCNEVNTRWPPPPHVDPNPRDPTLLYPGDVDPDFQPSRGDILVIHPGLHIGLMDLHRQLPKDGFVSCYDGSPSFEFALGDLVLRMGTYDVKSMIVEPEKKEVSEEGKGERSPPKKAEGTKKKGQAKDKKEKGGSMKKRVGKKGKEDVEQKVMEKPKSFTYNPYERLELYTCSGFISAEEQARLEAERLALELEKERLENEAKLKGSKGKKDKKAKENPKGGGKEKPQERDGKKKGGKGKEDGKVEAPAEKDDPKVPPIREKWVEENIPSSKDGEPPSKEKTQEQIHGLLVVDTTKLRPKPKWRYLGSQMQLSTKNQQLLEKQCPGLTYVYRRYMKAGTRCDMHSLTPILGEILINIGWLNNWYKNLEKWQKEENKYKSLVKWYKPDLPNRGELIPGMILLRPLVGREHGSWVGWGLDGKKLPTPLLHPPLAPKEEDECLQEFHDIDEQEISPPPKCDCHRKSPCPKPPCPCHLYDPCPKLPDCGCIYCNPLPRKPKPPPHVEKPIEDQEIDKNHGKGKGKDIKGKGKDGKNIKEEKFVKGVKGDPKDGKDVKQRDKKLKSKDSKNPEDQATNMIGKDEKHLKSKEEENKDVLQEDQEVPKRPYVWGAVEMYLFYGEQEGWEYWGRSDRICDTPYPITSKNAKPKFLHVDDSLKVEEILEEEKIGQKNEEILEVKQDSLAKKFSEKNTKQGAKDGVNKKLQQEDPKKNTKKS